jgi:hypothetical protein
MEEKTHTRNMMRLALTEIYVDLSLMLWEYYIRIWTFCVLLFVPLFYRIKRLIKFPILVITLWAAVNCASYSAPAAMMMDPPGPMGESPSAPLGLPWQQITEHACENAAKALYKRGFELGAAGLPLGDKLRGDNDQLREQERVMNLFMQIVVEKNRTHNFFLPHPIETADACKTLCCRAAKRRTQDAPDYWGAAQQHLGYNVLSDLEEANAQRSHYEEYAFHLGLYGGTVARLNNEWRTQGAIIESSLMGPGDQYQGNWFKDHAYEAFPKEPVHATKHGLYLMASTTRTQFLRLTISRQLRHSKSSLPSSNGGT